jgi:cytochrome c-type biogenesis protein CcmH
MTLWLILSLMTAAAMFAVLWPLSRRGSAPSQGQDIAVYRDQLDEVERDRKSGLIGDAEAEAARLEISRRLLAAADKVEPKLAEPKTKSGRKSQPNSEDPASLWRRRAAALIALFALPALSAGLYMKWGSPQLPGAPLATRADLPLEQRSIESMVAQVEAHLERRPNDGRGWEVVAPVYMKMGRFNDAVRARANVVRILGSTASREAELGEAQVAAANGVVTAEAKQSFERALKLDAADLKAQYFVGLAAEQDGRLKEAAHIWGTMLDNAPPNAPYRPLIQQSLARLASKGIAVEPKAPQPGPSQDDIAASQQLTPEQRAEMIRGMVERLADRLKTDGSDFESWVRLVRAYVVMGDADKAREALNNARNAVGTDPEKRNRLDALAESLGLKG